jgi:hypothetical protein
MASLLDMGQEFISEAWAGIADFDEGSTRQTLEALLEAGILLVAEADGRVTGMLGAVVTPLYFNRSETIAQELFWWVRPEARTGTGKALLDAFEAEARDRGATIGGMNAMEDMRANALARIYARRGYRQSERAFIRRL